MLVQAPVLQSNYELKIQIKQEYMCLLQTKSMIRTNKNFVQGTTIQLWYV